MPIFALLLGILFVDAGVRGNSKDVFSQLASDAKGFLALGFAVMILAVVGSVNAFRPVSKSLLILLFVVFILKNGNNVVKGITASASATSANDTTSTANTSPSETSESNQQAAKNANDAVNFFSEVAPYLEMLGE